MKKNRVPKIPATYLKNKRIPFLLEEIMQGCGLTKRQNYFGFKLPPYVTGKKKGKP